MLKKKFLALFLVFGLIAANVTPAFAQSQSKTSVPDDELDFIYLGKKALTAKKTESGTVYWDFSAQDLIQALVTLNEDVPQTTRQITFGNSDFKKVSDKNIFRYNKDSIQMDIYTTSSSRTEGRVTKFVSKVTISSSSNKSLSGQIESFIPFVSWPIIIFTQYDIPGAQNLVSSLEDGSAFSLKTAQYQYDINDASIVFTVVPKIKS